VVHVLIREGHVDIGVTATTEVVPGLVEVEVAVPHLSPAAR
jgi:hypothetical protein